ncbi:MAG: hypothetical protein JWL85_680 [Candidatus Saccharibacteria bacterium]|nr:hypothetical protein [Candidatus Saccharibacteria bacterium]
MEFGNRGPQPLDNVNVLKKKVVIEPLLADYVHRPVQESFNWHKILNDVRGQRGLPTNEPIYLFVFRSLRKPDLTAEDIQLLTDWDAAAHVAAEEADGFLAYFGGEPDEHGACISFCLWRSREAALAGTAHPDHQTAARLITMYAAHDTERYDIPVYYPHKFDARPYAR